MFAKSKGRALLFVALVVAWWSVAVTIGCHIDPFSQFKEFSILNGLASALALYAGLGRATPAARAVVLLLGLSVAVALEASFGEWPGYYPPLVSAGANAAITLAAYLAVRAARGPFVREPWSIRALMVTTAAVGVLFACLGGLRADSGLGRSADLALWSLQGLALALVAVASALPMRSRRPWLVLIAVPGAIALATALGYFGDYWATGNWRHPGVNLRWHAAVAVVHAILVGGPIWTLAIRRPGVSPLRGERREFLSGVPTGPYNGSS